MLELGLKTHRLGQRSLLEASQAENKEAMLLLRSLQATDRDPILRHALGCACEHSNLCAIEALAIFACTSEEVERRSDILEILLRPK